MGRRLKPHQMGCFYGTSKLVPFLLKDPLNE
jgi:hypothetical protein